MGALFSCLAGICVSICDGLLTCCQAIWAFLTGLVNGVWVCCVGTCDRTLLQWVLLMEQATRRGSQLERQRSVQLSVLPLAALSSTGWMEEGGGDEQSGAHAAAGGWMELLGRVPAEQLQLD